MKKLGFLLLLAASAFGQSTAGPFIISSGTSACAQIDVSGQSAVGISVTGTFSATLQPEVAIQGQAATNIQVTPSTSSTAQSTITAAGNYTASVGGYSTFLVCVTAYTSGTATIRLNTVKTTASNGGTGGGGGSTSPLTTKGDLFGHSTVDARVPVGANTFVLTADSTQALGLKWAAPAGASFPINLPDGSSAAPQLSSASNPTDGFYIAAARPNWIFEVGGTQMFALRGTIAGGARAFAFGASTQPCWASSNTLDANDSANCDTYLSRASANALNLGSSASAVDGQLNTGTANLSISAILPDASSGAPALKFASDTSTGLYKTTLGAIIWQDGFFGQPNWGFTPIIGAGGGGSAFNGIVLFDTTNSQWGFQDPLVNPTATGLKCNPCLNYGGTGQFNIGTSAPGNSSGSLGLTTLLATAVTATGTSTGGLFATGQNCAASGTAANPSVVACSAAPSGVVYCDVASSAGTCTINTTAAGTNSDITITSTASANARLGKTCNTAPSVVPGIPIASISNGVSFTINVETGITNGFCYFYNIVNK